MCGISAIYSNIGIDSSRIVQMNDLIRHRGPDGEGYFLTDLSDQSHSFSIASKDLTACEQKVEITGFIKAHNLVKVAIGHRRLSIVDLSLHGLQPMVSSCGNHVIAFNGEIYNFKEIKEELIAADYVFISTTDTEVLLNAYLHWGKDVLNRLNGMFAFQIYNTKYKTLFAARDRYGVKPLYYWQQKGELALASEIKQFTCLPGWRASLNIKRAYDFLKFGLTEHTEETMFDNVYQVPPGHFFEVDFNRDYKILPESWYELKPVEFNLNFNDAKKKFKELFSVAVNLRLQADVPVGTGLSGGMDSSSIACEINSLLKKSNKDGFQKTFSACTNVKKYDEKNYIKDVLANINAEPHFVYPQAPTKIELIEKAIWHQDEPFGTTSIFAEWSVFSLAQQNGVKVTLDGHGADESLAGYHNFLFINLVELLIKGKFYRFFKEIKALKKKHGYPLTQTLKAVVYYYKNSFSRLVIKEKWFKPAIGKIKLKPTNLKLIDESFAEFSTSSIPMQMHWCDRDSMAHSVESRAPFLDPNLVEFILSCPSDYKISSGVSKFILRESLRDLLPKNIYRRLSKIGYATPEEEWLTEEHKADFLRLLDDSVELTKDVLTNEAFVISRKIINKELPYNGFAWRVICFANWMKIFNVKIGLGVN